ALNLDPQNASVTGLPTATVAGDYLLLSFAANPDASDVSFVVEGSPDLATWSASNAELVSGGSVFTYRYASPINGIARGFLRLRVTRTDL
ncbi:MAG: hypothetical protein M3Y86_08455, partial [Verrucomicrobiota bacterium]|nr:hypothetical protein [Verrucomicrobiota bacterium]